ncbi:MAG: hypothetical protein Q8R24_04715 [Legionellaceae bacterium]|nr:hypothetical protein [Legionellaceae bacterium]
MNPDFKLPKIDEKCDVLPISGQHGVCRSYYQPDEFDIKALVYANELVQQSVSEPHALDLGCSPYFPQSQRLARLGFYVDAFDLEKPVANFAEINQQYNNRICYKSLDLKLLQENDLTNQYKIVYSNRCLSFLSYPDTYRLIRTLINHNKCHTRYFLAFFTIFGKYAENYPTHLPLVGRYVPLNNTYAERDEMLAPVCLYTRDEILHELLGELPISIIDIIKAKSGSLKIIFDV